MSTSKTVPVKGMHCASCAATIEKTLKNTSGVSSAEVNYGTETAKISFDERTITLHTLSQAIEPLGYTFSLPPEITHGEEMLHAEHLGLSQTKIDRQEEIAHLRRVVMQSIAPTAISIFVMGWDIFAAIGAVPPMSSVWKEFFHHLLPLLATFILFSAGKPYMSGALRFFRTGYANMDSLVGIGTGVAYVYSFLVTAFEGPLRQFIDVESMYYDVTIVVIVFITLGKYLEAKSKKKTGDAIEKLLELQAKTAIVKRDGVEKEVSIQEVVHGDVLLVKPGMRIPVDGILLDGSSYVDESMLTGEPTPSHKEKGDAVAAGTINTSGSFYFTAIKVGSETLLAHIIDMVEEAQASKAPIQTLADKISSFFVPVVLALACLSFGLWLLLGIGPLGLSQALSLGLVSFVGILVIACPCALGLATPTAIIVGVGKGAREGILIKDAATLQKLHAVDTVVVDKTGTITNGKPAVVSLQNISDKNDEDILAILMSLEKHSEHPIAHAILAYAEERGVAHRTVEKFESIKGRGVRGVMRGTTYYMGNVAFMEDVGAAFDFDAKILEEQTAQGRTPVLLAEDKKLIAVSFIADAMKPDAKEAIQKLHALRKRVVMLTGDNERTARAIAREAGIDEVFAEVLPDEKMKKIKELQNEGRTVAMVGDGVNDAPALAQADVGIAMATGTDVAIEAAGMTLLHGDISKVAKAFALSKITMRGIKQNLFWAFIYNMVGIPVAAGILYPVTGWMLSPVFAGLAMAFSSVSVVTNSLRIRAKKL